jgi:multidrug resistance efflux pump
MNAALESGVAGVGEMAPARKPARPRQLILAVLLAVAGVVAGVLTYKSLVSSPVSLSGEVVPTRVYPLSFGTTGTITAVKIRAGQHVTAGEVLATQNGALAQANLQEANASAAAAAAALQADQHPQPGVVVQPAAVATARQRLAAARAQATQDRLALKNTQVVAPAAGVVGAVSAAAGNSITASNLHNPVVTIDSGPLVVSARLPGTEVGNVRVGQAVTLTIEPLHVSLPGKVLQLSQVPSQSQTAVSYMALCQIETRDSALLAGMAADVIPQ